VGATIDKTLINEVKHQNFIGFSQWGNVTKKVGPSQAPHRGLLYISLLLFIS